MEKLSAVVKRVAIESPNVHTIYFLLKTGSKLDYVAGQYVTVFVESSTTPQGKAYSLSSAPHEAWMSITVKNIGEFSGYLCGLKVGDRFTISPAYGFFNPNTTRPLVALAAGVGISPIIGVLKDEFNQNAARQAYLFYTNKTVEAMAHSDALTKTNCQVTHHVTAQRHPPVGVRKGRIVLDECIQAAENAFYMICGSAEFVKDMWQGLTARGVLPESITTETFFES